MFNVTSDLVYNTLASLKNALYLLLWLTAAFLHHIKFLVRGTIPRCHYPFFAFLRRLLHKDVWSEEQPIVHIEGLHRVTFVGVFKISLEEEYKFGLIKPYI